MGHVVVGVDGSLGAQRALEFAVEEAHRREAGLLIVHVVDPSGTGDSALGIPDEFGSESAFQAIVEQGQRDQQETMDRVRSRGRGLIEQLLEEVGTDDLTVETSVVIDRRPARRLIELVNGDADADVLIIGSRGRGELTGMLLGSVSRACVAHSRIPVTVVPS